MRSSISPHVARCTSYVLDCTTQEVIGFRDGDMCASWTRLGNHVVNFFIVTNIYLA
jgi:hypothetical protein